LGIEATAQPEPYGDEVIPPFQYAVVPLAAARYCWQNGVSLGLRGGYGIGFISPVYVVPDTSPHHQPLLDAQVALKWCVGTNGAIRVALGVLGYPRPLTAGYPRSLYGVGELTYLHDFSDLVTGFVSLATARDAGLFPATAKLGISLHSRVAEQLLGHAALCVGTLGAGAGFGLDVEP
jgi:hypothetical protein